MFDVFSNLVTDEKSKLFYMQLVAKRRSVNNLVWISAVSSFYPEWSAGRELKTELNGENWRTTDQPGVYIESLYLTRNQKNRQQQIGDGHVYD